MLHWLSGPAAVFAAEIYLLVRLALVGFLVERLRSDRLSIRTLLAGVGLAAVALGISVFQAAIGH